jgi:hypothetical protein
MNRNENEAESFGGNFVASGEQKLFFEVPLSLLLESKQPKLVVCYGTMARVGYSQLLGFEKWESVAESVWKAPNANHFLLPFFGNGQMSEDRLAMLVDSNQFRSLLRNGRHVD